MPFSLHPPFCPQCCARVYYLLGSQVFVFILDLLLWDQWSLKKDAQSRRTIPAAIIYHCVALCMLHNG